MVSASNLYTNVVDNRNQCDIIGIKGVINQHRYSYNTQMKRKYKTASE